MLVWNGADEVLVQLAGPGRKGPSASGDVQEEGQGQGSPPPLSGRRGHAAAEEPRHPLLPLGMFSYPRDVRSHILLLEN